MMRRVDGKESILGDLENVSNGSVVEALWAFGPPEPKKRLSSQTVGSSVVERVPKTAPKGVVFCHLFRGLRVT